MKNWQHRDRGRLEQTPYPVAVMWKAGLWKAAWGKSFKSLLCKGRTTVSLQSPGESQGLGRATGIIRESEGVVPCMKAGMALYPVILGCSFQINKTNTNKETQKLPLIIQKGWTTICNTCVDTDRYHSTISTGCVTAKLRFSDLKIF